MCVCEKSKSTLDIELNGKAVSLTSAIVIESDVSRNIMDYENGAFSMSPTKQLASTLLSAQVLMQKSHHNQQHLLQQKGHTCTPLLCLLSQIHTVRNSVPLILYTKREAAPVLLLTGQMHTHKHKPLLCFLYSNAAVHWP